MANLLKEMISTIKDAKNQEKCRETFLRFWKVQTGIPKRAADFLKSDLSTGPSCQCVRDLSRKTKHITPFDCDQKSILKSMEELVRVRAKEEACCELHFTVHFSKAEQVIKASSMLKCHVFQNISS